MSRSVRLLAAWLACMSMCVSTPAYAGGFTYQGKLSDGGMGAAGAYDFEFRLFDSLAGGSQVGGAIAVADLMVDAGLFTVSLDFGPAAFSGAPRWLEIRVAQANGALTTLSPRQPISPAPYAHAAPWTGLWDMPAGFADGIDNETQYLAGAGLNLVGNTLSVDTTGAQQQQALCFVGGALSWGFPAASRLRLPWSETIADPEAALAIQNDGGGAAGLFTVDSLSGGTALQAVGRSDAEPTAYIESQAGGTALRVFANEGRGAYVESTPSADQTTLYLNNRGTGFTMFAEGSDPLSYGFDFSLSNAANDRTTLHAVHAGTGTVAEFRSTNNAGGSAVLAVSEADSNPVVDVEANGDATALHVTANHGRAADIVSDTTATETTLRAQNYGSGFTFIASGNAAGSRGASMSLTDTSNTATALAVDHAGAGIGFSSTHTGSFGAAGFFQITGAANDAPCIFASNQGTGQAVDVHQYGDSAAVEVRNHYSRWEAIYASSTDPTNASSALHVNHLGTGRGVRVQSRGIVGVHSVNYSATGSGRGGEFYLADTTNTDVGLTAFTSGIGPAFFCRGLNEFSSEIAFGAMNDGLGPTAQVTSLNAACNTAVLDVSAAGTGTVARFDSDNPLATAPALMVETQGRQPSGYFNQTGADANAARALELHCTNPGNSSWLMTAYQTGLGGGGYFEISTNGAGFGHALSARSANNVGALYAESSFLGAGNPASLVRQFGPNTGLFVDQQGSSSSSGFARAAEFFCGNASNASPAMVVTHLGLGRAGTFSTSSGVNNDITVTVNQAGSGSAMHVTTNHTGSFSTCMLVTHQGRGEGARFQNTNSANSNAAMVANTNGAGPAARFELVNSGSSANAVVMTSSGTGDTLNVSRGTGASRAAIFTGNVHVAGTLSASVKNFSVDHPTDPANRVLNHASIESSEMLNLYSGNVLLDADGQARVTLPPWFVAVNTDFRYQLTCVGAFRPVYVAQEITDGAFRIAGGESGMKVSWQITARRNDAFAIAHPMVVEAEKPANERGRYLNPELHGQPAELAIGAAPQASESVAPAQPFEPSHPVIPEPPAATSATESTRPQTVTKSPVVVDEESRPTRPPLNAPGATP